MKTWPRQKKYILKNKMVQERSFSQTSLMEGSLTLPRASSQVLVRVLLPEGTVRQARAHPESIISPESTGPTGTPGCSPPGLPDLPCTGPSAAPGTVSHPSWIPPPLDSTAEQSDVGEGRRTSGLRAFCICLSSCALLQFHIKPRFWKS